MSTKYPVWILIKRSAEIEGQWVSHCLELDVVSQGDSAEDAYKMGVEASQLAMKWDIQEGLDPRGRPQAPAECFDDLHYLIEQGNRFEVDEALSSDFRVMAVRVEFDLEKLERLASGEEEGDCFSPPPEPVMKALAKAA